MKKLQLLITSTLLCVLFMNAQDTVYVMKNGASVAEYNIATGVDSIIFYDPASITPPANNVPFYSGTLAVGNGSLNAWNNAPAMWYPNPGTNGQPAKYNYSSTAANTTVGLFVMFPPSYQTNTTKKYPVVYHLHGHGQSQTEQDAYLIKAYNAMQAGTVAEFIYISVGAPSDCWYSDGLNGVNAESHIINEILSLVDQTFRTLPKRESRAIEGFSMGGFGAHKIVMRYPQYFAAAGSVCGALYKALTESTTPYVQGISDGFNGNYRAIWNGIVENFNKDSARELLITDKAKIQTYDPFFYLHLGSTDPWNPHNRRMETDLMNNGYRYTTRETAGGHDMSHYDALYFKTLLDQMQTN